MPRRDRSLARATAVVLGATALLFFLVPFSGPGGAAQAGSPPRVVLTFDDGYGFDHRILEYLGSQGITATAFVIGSWAQQNPSLLAELDALGWDVCNHTQNHPWLTKVPDPQIVAELNTCQAVIGAATGQYLPVFRPPGGFIDARVTGVAAAAGYAPVMWDFDSADALNTNVPVQDRVNNMVNGARDGDILLFHFGGRNTLELVVGVVQGLQKRGFGFVTLSELYGWKQLIRGGDSGPGVVEASQLHYFAEGTTLPGFDEWLLLLNPGGKPALVKARYYSPSGELERDYTVPPHERLSVAVNAEVPWEDDVAVVLESSVPVAAERSLYFNRGGGNSGGSLSRGAGEPSSQFLFSEGTARPGFDEYLAVFNPSAIVEARVEVELHGMGAEPRRSAFAVSPLSRLTVKVNDLVGQGDYSMVLRSSTPVVAERSEYFVYNEILTGSHCASGAVRPGGRWYFAEGTTRDFFDGYLSVFNPCAYGTWLEVCMFASDGSLVKECLDLAAGERKTLFLDSYLPPEIDYSLSISSLLPITAERSTYFRTRNMAGGFCSAGVPRAYDHWLFPEGCTSPGFTEYLALFNPQASPQLVTVEFLRGDGETVSREYMLPAEGRVTIDVGIEAGQCDEMSVEIGSEAGIVAERSVYFNFQAL